MTTRRSLLTGFGAAALAAAVHPGLSFARGVRDDTRLVVVLLRGGMDGLAAVPPHGDPDFARVLASQRRFAESYAVWRRHAYPGD